MNPKELLKSLIKLLQEFGELHELDWFHTLGQNVNYSKYEHVKLVKPKVDHVIGGLSILYLFAIFESYFDNSEWKNYINQDDEKILRAFRHVRHSIAHGHHGSRAQPRSPRGINQEEYDAFEEVIENELFSPKNIIELDKSENTITINSGAGIYLKQYLQKITQDAIAEVAKRT